MKPEKFFFPVMVAAAIIGIYLLFRNPRPATVQGPNTAASGLPTIAPQAQEYQVNPPTVTPSPLVMLADPFSNNPQAPTPQKAPAYLAFNFGPSHDLTKTPFTPATTDAGTCGCGSKSGVAGSCGCGAIDNHFSDGSGCTSMSSSGKRLIAAGGNDPWLNAVNNFNGSDVIVQPFTPVVAPVQPPSDTQSNVNVPAALPPSSPKPVAGKTVHSKLPRIQAEFTGGGQNGGWGQAALFTPPYGSL